MYFSSQLAETLGAPSNKGKVPKPFKTESCVCRLALIKSRKGIIACIFLKQFRSDTNLKICRDFKTFHVGQVLTSLINTTVI